MMQNTVDCFANRDSAVYMASIDASKAFDRINHKILFYKLVKRGAPKCFIGTLIIWYNKLFPVCSDVLRKSFSVLCAF